MSSTANRQDRSLRSQSQALKGLKSKKHPIAGEKGHGSDDGELPPEGTWNLTVLYFFIV